MARLKIGSLKKQKRGLVIAMLMVSLILVPILMGVLLYLFPLKLGKVIMVLMVQAYLAVVSVSLLLRNMAEGTFFEVLGGDDPILYVALRGDRTSLVFVCLAVLLFMMAFLYAIRDEQYFNKKFLLLFLVLQGTLNGIFMTDDIFNLFVLIEVSTVLATVLLLFKRDGRNAYDGLFYITMQIVTMMFFLFGIAYLYRSFGVLNFTAMYELMAMGVPRETLILPFSFLMTGIALKIGFFPLFSWVSHAYGNPSAPFPVLAILSGLFVKSSLFFVIRMHHMFYPTLDYTRFFIVLGLLTGVMGAVKALAQKDIKLMLAFSTISQVGLITVGIFLPDTTSLYGSLMHIVNHALFKSLLFLGAGMIAKEYQTTHVNEIKGLFKRMPLVATAMLLGVLGIIGFPFVNGSMSKYWMMAEASLPMELALWVVNIGTILVFVKYSTMFFGPSEKVAKQDPVKTAVVMFMGILCVLVGVLGAPVANLLFGVTLSFNMASFLAKGVIFFVILGVAVLFYRIVLVKTDALYKIAKSPTTVQQSCLILLIFFATLVLYGTLT